jgi:pSer/pThr/pTyr-binding forkhead associated (FHA) protein
MEAVPSFLLQEVNSNRSFKVSSEQVTVIGREYDCQIVLDSNHYGGVSRHHASIRPWAMADLSLIHI